MDTTFILNPLDDETADDVRTTLRSPGYGHPAWAGPAEGYGPCRVCLRKTRRDGDHVILFTHDPFSPQPWPLPGRSTSTRVHASATERSTDSPKTSMTFP
jgi:hypothetical protein